MSKCICVYVHMYTYVCVYVHIYWVYRQNVCVRIQIFICVSTKYMCAYMYICINTGTDLCHGDVLRVPQQELRKLQPPQTA